MSVGHHDNSLEYDPATLGEHHTASGLTYLVDDVDAVVDLLSAEDRVEVVQPVLEVVFPVAEWDDDGDLEAAATVLLSHSVALYTTAECQKPAEHVVNQQRLCLKINVDVPQTNKG